MARIYRVSGYIVSNLHEDNYFNLKSIQVGALNEALNLSCETWQQLHIEESEKFEPDGEFEENCDLALLTRHFNHIYPPVIDFDRPLPQRGEVYKHFKIGKLVKVLGLSRHTESEEITVVYEHEHNLWNRPLSMFMSEVDKDKYPNATQKYRFEKVN